MTDDRIDPRRGSKPPSSPERLRSDLSPIVDACLREDAVGFVAVGDRFDVDLRYLTRFSGSERHDVLVIVPDGTGGKTGSNDVSTDGRSVGRAVLSVPPGYAPAARREFVGSASDDERNGDDRGVGHDGVLRTVATTAAGDPAGVRAAAVLDDCGDSAGDAAEPPVLVPRTIPHDAAVYLEGAGFTLTSTPVVDRMRAVKSSAEIDAIRRVQEATAWAMVRTESVLADCRVALESGSEPGPDVDPDEYRLVRNGTPLTADRLRREIRGFLTDVGLRGAGNTVVDVGTRPGTTGRSDVDHLLPGSTVTVGLSPRGPTGYVGQLTRTFVVDGDGGWERRAAVAVEAAREAGLAAIEPGVTAAAVHREIVAELAAYGFDPTADGVVPGITHDFVHGIGMDRHEPPTVHRGDSLEPGTGLAIVPGVSDPDLGVVRLGDALVVTEEGYELLATYPLGTRPKSPVE